MPLPWAARGLRDGIVTSRWPRRPDDYFDGFAAAVAVDQSADGAAAQKTLVDAGAVDSLCPTDAIGVDGERVTLDRGRCVMCGRCVAAAPAVFGWAPGSATATLDRRTLVVGAEPDPATLDAVRARLRRRTRRLRRSVHIRHVDAGSDGSDEWEVQALLNPVYDIHRLGIFITASPRHADILLVTGVGTPGMAEPLRRTREAMPDPVVVIATGADAISGGLADGGWSNAEGAASLLDVDVWVPGAPAPPFALLHAILLALDRVPADQARRRHGSSPDRRRPSP